MKKIRNLLANSKSINWLKRNYLLLVIPPMMMATSCKKDPIEPACTDYTNPECPNYDPCYGVNDTYNSKKTAEQNAANNVRSTFQALKTSSFGTAWNSDFNFYMHSYLQQNGIDSAALVIKDTAIVAKQTCDTTLAHYGQIPGFMDQIGPLIYNNKNADSTYIVTEQDMINYYLQNQSCIGH